MTQTPILFISDSVSCSSGLGRITRDLATRLNEYCSDIFRVGTFGYGGPGSRTLPFQQYAMEGLHNWFIPTLRQVWEDFAGNEPGVVFTIWDASRLLWFTRPEDYCEHKYTRDWLSNPPFKKWGYIPIDAKGPNDSLSCMIKECLMGYDNLIAYTDWGKTLIENTIGLKESDERNLSSLPHGIDTSVFFDQYKDKSRKIFSDFLGFKGPEIRSDELLIGIVATNQPRKDYGFAIQVLADLAKKMPIRLFIHTDALERHWSIPALLSDYGLLSKAIVNITELDNSTMSVIYSACDLTLGIGLGEGFGFPCFESLACNTPCITGSYGGQAEFMDWKMIVKPEMMRLEGLYNCQRPVYSRTSWVKAIQNVIGLQKAGKLKAELPANLDWKNLWPRWEAYFREAHRSLHLQETTQDQTSSTPEMGKEQSGSRILSFASQAGRKMTEAAPVSVEPCL
jgi:glycosyltransferase involved in cell wall biosynthesis